jgi:4-hydroxybenzoate polyprenyltransferase
LFTSLFAACCALGMCMATERLILKSIPSLFSPLHLLVFGSTLVVYNTHYIIKRSTPEISDRFAWSQHYRLWHLICLGTGVVCCLVSLFYLNMQVLAACVVLGLLSFAYSLPMLPLKNKRRLKDFGWIKILVLTLVWTIVTGVLPMLYWHVPLSQYPFEILIRFVFLFTLCVAFDIRDMQTDLEAGIYTLPNLIGMVNSYRLMNVAIFLFALLSIIQYIRYPNAWRLGAELLSAIATKLAIEYSRRHASDRVYLGLIDGMMLLYAILVLVQ